MQEPTSPRLGRRMLGFGLLVSLAACATHIQDTTAASAPGTMPPPARVLVYDFTIDSQNVALDTSLRARLSQISVGDAAEEGQAIAAEVQNTIAETLVRQIQAMGLPAMRAGPGTTPSPDDLAVRGRITRISAGNETRRRVIGFGAGKSEIDAAAELLRSSPGGPTLLQSYIAEANSGHTPGLALGGASAAAGHAGAAIGGTTVGAASRARSGLSAEAEHIAERIATNLGQFFKQQGWVDASAVPPTGQ
ncbi:MAG: DUF4410 domain-containing protein [Acetobacteraceae bacterium]